MLDLRSLPRPTDDQYAGFAQHVGGPVELPAELWRRCTFTLFPYVAGGGRDAVGWAHEEAVRQLRAGAAHPRRADVLEWARLAREHDEGWQELSDAEREVVLALDGDGAEKPTTTPAIERYLGIEAGLDSVYYERLRPEELEKIRRALGELRACLDGR